MSLFFYLLSFLFIWSELYSIYNKIRLQNIILNRDIKLLTKFDFVFYLTKLFFILWVIVGIWSSHQNLFILMISLIFLKFPFFHINKKLYAVWENILPVINIVQILHILITYLLTKH